MFAEIQEAVARIEAVVAGLEPGALSGRDARTLVGLFAQGERVCGAGKALCARRVEETFVTGSDGHRSAASWLAETTGEPLGQALGILETARRVEHLPEVDQALRAGALSGSQAREVAAAGSACPAAQSELVALAGRSTIKSLRQACRTVVASARSPEEEATCYEAIRRSRYCRTWSEADGAFRLDARLVPDDGARVLVALGWQRDHLFETARRAGRHEPYHAMPPTLWWPWSPARPSTAGPSTARPWPAGPRTAGLRRSGGWATAGPVPRSADGGPSRRWLDLQGPKG